MHKQCKGKVILSVLLSIIMVFSVVTVGTVSMSAEASTSSGLCAYALNAYNEGWPYVWGGASYGAVDCSGLICSYNGVGGVRTDMISSSQSAGLDWGYVSEGVPNIHGLGLHKPGHVGIYVGSGNAIDARGTNWGIIYGSLSAVSWVEWYKIVGVTYPENGWFEFDGDSFYYENGEYIESTTRTIDGVKYSFDSLGRSDKAPSDSAYDKTDYSSVSVPSSSSSYLKIGSQGDRVVEVQQLLKDLGYFDDEVTGYYGTYTAACVKEFQTDADIEVDGVVGPEFMSAIKSEDAPKKDGAVTSEKTTGVATEEPTEEVTEIPTEIITEEPTEEITEEPTEVVTEEITEEPTEEVTEAPTEEITEAPTEEITEEPTEVVTEKATEEVTEEPTEVVTEAPTEESPLDDGIITYGEYDVEGKTDIADMQKRLAELGYSVEITGIFNDDTVRALHKYFSNSEMKEEDFITQEQYEVLMSKDAIAEVNNHYSQEEIDNVQSLLVTLGYLENANGVYGDDTINAIKTAQANFDMAVTGELSDEFVKALELAAARTEFEINSLSEQDTESPTDTATNNSTTTNSSSSSTTPVANNISTNSGNTTAVNNTSSMSNKTSPVTGYHFSNVSSPLSNDDLIFVWISGMIIALTMGTAIVYIKNKAVKRKRK